MSTHSTGRQGLAEWSVEAVHEALTAERLRSYLRASDGDLSRALELYEWNMEASSSVLRLTGMVEVIVRNALDRELTAWSERKNGDTAWFAYAPLDHRGSQDVAKARARATQGGRRAERHGKVIAELTFGFWRYLLDSRYLTALWVPATHRAFPAGADDLRQRHREVLRRMQQLHFVRNRVSHHEPIHRRDLARDECDALDVIRWVSRAVGPWVEAHADVSRVLDAKPGWYPSAG